MTDIASTISSRSMPWKALHRCSVHHGFLALTFAAAMLLSACGGSDVATGIAESGQPDGTHVSDPAPPNPGTGSEPPINDSAGDGSSVPTEAPLATSLSVSGQPNKILQFSWNSVEGVDHYRLLEDATGSSGYTQSAILPAATLSHDLEVFLPERVSARYLVEACNAAGCAASNTVHASTHILDAIGSIKTSNPSVEDYYGYAVSVSSDGNTLAVGARGKNGNTGAVYVYTKGAAGWSKQAIVTAALPQAGSQFGFSIALSADGTRLAVGANLESTSTRGINQGEGMGSAQNSGAAYVFARDGETWVQQAYVKASNADANDWFGYAVALSADGSTLAVSARAEASASRIVDQGQSNNDATNAGAVYVFTHDGSSWMERSYIKPLNLDAGDYFGQAVALSADGTLLAVGSRGESSAGTADPFDNSLGVSGAVYVFASSAGVWEQRAYIKASNASAWVYFGVGLSFSADGSVLAVGTERENSSGTGVYASTPPANGDASQSGAVYIFGSDDGLWNSWVEQVYIKASNAAANDRFGSAVALSNDGNTLAVGAYHENGSTAGLNGDGAARGVNRSGAAYLFKRQNGVWTQTAYIKASDTSENAWFGKSVAFSSGPDLLVVGAYGERTGITAEGASDPGAAPGSGAIYLY